MNSLLILLLDAFNPSYLEYMPFLSSLEGARIQPMIGYNCTLASIFTGLTPAEHGKWNIFDLEPTLLPFMRMLRLYGKPAIYKILFSHGAEFKVANLPLKGRSLLDRLKQENVEFLYYNHPRWCENRVRKFIFQSYSDEGVLRKVLGRLNSYQFVFLHLYDLDRVGHRENWPELVSFLNVLDSRVEKLLGIWKGRVLIFSDHGMHDVDRLIDVRGIVKGETHFLESTMVRLWNPSTKLKRKLEALGSGRFLTKMEKDYYVSRRAQGTDFWCLKRGGLISPNFWSKSAPRRMHGYIDEPETILLCNDSLKKNHYQMPELHDLITYFLGMNDFV